MPEVLRDGDASNFGLYSESVDAEVCVVTVRRPLSAASLQKQLASFGRIRVQ